MEKTEKRKGLNKLTLQIIAMATMLIDHIGVALVPVPLLRYIGRLAFPIFAYFIAEGFARTGSFKKYLLRMALFAVISEIPFNLVAGGTLFYFPHQNVMFTFCIALLCLLWLDKLRQRHEGTLLWAVDVVLVCLVGYAAGYLLHVDYGGRGILLVIGFSLCRELSGYYRYGGELLCMALFAIVKPQALLSLPLIWLYDGEQGPHNKVIQYACYAFYPAHLLIIGLIAQMIR